MIAITLWGNCQLGPLAKILNTIDNYKASYFINYEYNMSERDLPLNFYDCDVFISQNTKLEGKYSLTEIKKKLKPDVKIILVPYIVFTGYWPGENIEIQFRKNNCPHHKFGLWPLQVKIPYPNIAEKEVQKSLEILAERESQSDISGISNYIRDNYKKRRLFYCSYHPYEEITHLMYKQIYEQLGLKYNFPDVSNGFEIFIMPIHDIIVDELKLEFDNNGFNIFHPTLIKYEEWYTQQLIDFQGNGKCKYCYKNLDV